MRKATAILTLAVLPLGGAYARQADLTRYALPPEVAFPEGIAYDSRTGHIYTGSAESGVIVRMDAKAPDSRGAIVAKEVVKGQAFPGVLGMTLDDAGRLWIAGGRTGKIAVLDAKAGEVLKEFDTPAQPGGLINDVAVVGSDAYFTDSLRPTLWRIGAKGGQIGALEPWLKLEETPIQYAEGPNLNGITATADGRYLITVQMNKGQLFRIDVADKQVVPIDIAGEALNTADGLVLDGRTLYVVRQGEQEIVTIQLSEDLTKGKVVSRFKDPALLWPATAEKVGDRLLVVNTQFNRRNTKDPLVPFSIIGVPLSRLSGK